MTGLWKKLLVKSLWSVLACAVVGVMIVACNDESPLPTDVTASEPLTGLMATLGPDVRLTASCGGGNQTPYVDEIAVNCVEIWGQSSHIPYSQYGSTWAIYTCKAWGTAVQGPAAGQYRLVATPSSEPFQASMSGAAIAETLDPMYFTMKAYGLRPTTPSSVSCWVGASLATLPVTIDGSAPVLVGVGITPATGSIPAGQNLQLTAHYYDNYGFDNFLTPVPSHTFSSNNTAVATVDPASGLVHGVAAGTATIQLAASGNHFATANITVTAYGCTLTPTPNGTVNSIVGGTVSISATSSCAGGAVLPTGNWIWPQTGPLWITNDNPQNSQVEVHPTGAGTATVKVCTPAGANQVCSADIGFNIFGTSVTSSADGTTLTPGLNATGTVTYTIKNIGPVAGTATVSCVSSAVVTCTGLSATSVTLNPGATSNVTASWATGTATGSASFGVAASGGGGDSWPSFTVNGGAVVAAINYGPASVQRGVNCEWMASVNGGTAPYSWAWTVDGAPVTGSDNDLYYINTGHSFTLGITVTDALGVTGSATKAITVTSSAPYCEL